MLSEKGTTAFLFVSRLLLGKEGIAGSLSDDLSRQPGAAPGHLGQAVSPVDLGLQGLWWVGSGLTAHRSNH